jgi:PAS domain S-box-containing protein
MPLPATTNDQSPPTANEVPMARILIVEDSITQALQLQAILEDDGHLVEVAPDGEQGFDLFNAKDFDLVISDIQMPGMSGYELCRKIKNDPVRKKVPVILLTALTDPMDIINGLECGADNFITKPYRREYLLRRVNTILDNNAHCSVGKFTVGAEVFFLGKRLTINSDKEQILDLLASTFEDVVRTNRELRTREKELASAKNQVDQYARQLEGRVRSTEDKYRKLMEQAQDAIFLLDPLGRVMEVNQRAEKTLGQPSAEIVGCGFEKFMLATELDRWRAQHLKLLADGFVRADNLHLTGANGRIVNVDLSASIVEINGEHIVQAIAHDVTERKRLEQQFLQAQKMQAIGQLAGGVAHDFNNLLTVICGFSEVLLSQLSDTDPASGMVQEIHKAGERAAGLTRQLLAFSRKQINQPKVLDLNALASDVGKMLRHLIGEDVSLTTVLAPRLGWVKADPGQIEQVLMNLAVNARDAMPEGGKLTIETANVDLDENFARANAEVKPGRYVLLAVSDTGCGMTEEVKAHTFEPFFTTKEPGKGTGLGLATVYGIVKQSRGYVYIYSEPGHGTTFKIYLPMVEDDAPSGKSHPEPKPMPKGNETILLVEDEDAVRSLTRYTLQMQGYAVLEAKDGEEALRVAEKNQGGFHLLLTDVVMPRMSGRRLAERLSQTQPGVKVLFLSGYTDDAVVRNGVLEAEVAFLQKPFTPSGLAQKVRNVLDQ